MHVLRIDIETYSTVNLRESGVYKYVDDPEFEILLFGYAVDNGPINVIDLACGDCLPANIRQALTDPMVIKKAFNANFERTALQVEHRAAMPPEQWKCTMIKALTLGLPGSLEEVGKALGLPAEDKKYAARGKKLVSFFCKPCKPTKANGFKTRNLPEDYPELWAEFKEYNRQDVKAEWAIDEMLDKYPQPPEKEHQLWCTDQRMNEQGVRVSMDLVYSILEYSREYTEKLVDEAIRISKVNNPGSVMQVKAWLKRNGYDVGSLNKDTLKDLLKTTADDKKINKFLQVYKELTKRSIKKYNAIVRAVCRDGRIRGMLQFYGANRTGRWAGRVVQLQNLPKNKMKDLADARDLLLEKDYDFLELLYYPKINDVLSQLVRTAFIANHDDTLVVADYSAIEARVLAWLADEKWRLDVFKSHGKIYEASAAVMFHIPIETIAKDSMERSKGKVAELALGYQGANGALERMGAAEWMTEDEMTDLVKTWRAANKNIVRYWYDIEAAAKDAIMRPGYIVKVKHGIAFQVILDTLFITLPSGRKLAYKNARIRNKGQKVEIVYQGVDQETKVWTTLSTYGGKIVENITQAVARDCLGEAILRLEKSGYLPLFHVHDEVVISVAASGKDDHMRIIKEIMGEPLPWAPGLILTADAYTTPYYLKD